MAEIDSITMLSQRRAADASLAKDLTILVYNVCSEATGKCWTRRINRARGSSKRGEFDWHV